MVDMVKVTFTIDERTVETLSRMAARLKKPKSLVFREAIQHYAEQADRLSEAERQRMLAALDRMNARKPTRSDADVEAEIAQIRKTRQGGGRRHPVK
jgi:predicted transcriptional regulator